MLQYTFRNENYFLVDIHNNSEMLIGPLVSLCYDVDSHLLLHHGSEHGTQRFYDKMRAIFLKGNFEKELMSLQMATGKFRVDFLNRVLSYNGDVTGIEDQIQNNLVEGMETQTDKQDETSDLGHLDASVSDSDNIPVG